ncbi:MAG: BtpA/SgcQ family protein, partial [Chthoniobacterales bacterium]
MLAFQRFYRAEITGRNERFERAKKRDRSDHFASSGRRKTRRALARNGSHKSARASAGQRCATGTTETGAAADPARLRLLRETLPDAPLVVGSGVTPENAASFDADGVIAGTSIKRGGDVDAPVDAG